ncbi:MAG TPA: 3-oxoacyl-ACP reductase FabG [Chitinivibrionales bacterium]|nr:3-oxoacyl-ACP reductase FabG [Chitinivibrionales bacterium]
MAEQEASAKRTAIVTGGSRGIGRAISERLAADGFHVVVNYRSNTKEAEETLGRIQKAGGSGELCRFDVTDRNAVKTAMENLLKRHAAVSALVVCAGIRHDELLIFMTEEHWDSVLATDLFSFHAVVKPVVKQMVLNHRGRIIVISSTSGESGLPGQVNYSAAKAGLIGAVKALALECAKRNVLVNAVTPGFIETDMTEALVTKELKQRIPMFRVGKPEEVAGVVSFLASDDASYITGQVIGVNGGIYM